MANRLEALLQKQLRQQEWSEDVADFIKNFGGEMAYVMGYFGNHHDLQDDAARWAEIAAWPDRGTLFAVATGRPRPFYLLYPWKGLEVLCTRAVFPYFEYESDRRLTDREWTATLNTPEAVSLPRWAQPLYLAK